jgi:diguanylate cyclase (GGDEF)-like protein
LSLTEQNAEEATVGILIVDDAETMRTSGRALLERVGYRDVWAAASAAEAFEVLGIGKPAQTGPAVDAILMDILMPGISGIEACRAIKSEDRLRDIPIIMVTGQTEDGDLEAAFAAGAADYITKPIKPTELLARLRSALTLKHELDQRRQRQFELLEMTRRLQEMNRELERLSTQDPLTGLANRRVLNEALAREWARALRDSTPLACIMMDIDHFKDYNDHYGHPQGDECLRRVAQALRNQIKRPADTLARYGGEEFAALLPRTDAKGAAAVAEAFHASVATLRLEHDGLPLKEHVSLSLGVTAYVPERSRNAEDLLTAADHALYEAKHQGRDRIVVAGQESHAVAGS